MTKEMADDELLKARKKNEEVSKKMQSKFSESNSPATYSPIDDQSKSKRGRKPSQAKLAMLESKKLLADKRKFFDADGDGKRNIKKKKSFSDDQKHIKKTDIISNQKNRKKKIVKVSTFLLFI